MCAIERLGPADLDDCERLSAEAGWNQTADDWAFLLGHGEVFGIRRGGRVIASAAIMPYPPVSWICMVLVTAAERRQGHATRLLARCIARNAEFGLASGLDATPAGRAVYLGLGFRDEMAIMRMRAARPDRRLASDDRSVAPVRADDVETLLAYDRRHFGADRGALLRHLLLRAPAVAHLARRDGRLCGFVLGRNGRTATQLGPLVADDEAVATGLAASALGRLPDGPLPVIVDVPLHRPRLSEWLAAAGFAAERPFTRMLSGGMPPGDLSRLMAITGPEFS